MVHNRLGRVRRVPDLPGMERLKRLSEISKETGLSVKVLRGAIRRGDLKATQPGVSESAWFYVKDSDVQDFLQASRPGREPRLPKLRRAR